MEKEIPLSRKCLREKDRDPKISKGSQSIIHYELVIAGAYCYDIERYHDFAVEIMYFLNEGFLLSNHDNNFQ